MVCPKFVPSWVLEFHSVGELSCQGCELEIECQLHTLLLLERCEICRKIFGQFLREFWRASSTQCLNLKNILRAGGQGRKRTKFLVFIKLETKDFLPFPRKT